MSLHHIIHHASIVRQNEVQKDPYDRSDDERSLDDKVDSLFEPLQVYIATIVVQDLVKPRRSHNVDEPDAQRYRQDEAVASSKADQTEDPDTGHGDRTIKENLHSSEHRWRHGTEDGSKLGEEAHQNKESRGRPACTPGL